MKHYCICFLITPLFLLFSISVTARAEDIIDDLFQQESQLNNSFILGISNTASNSSTYDLELGLFINQSLQLLLYTDYTDIHDQDFNFNSQTLDLGVSFQVDDSIRLAIHTINSGQEKQLLAKTLRATLAYYAVEWDVAISPEKSTIKLNSIRRTVNQRGLGFNFNYYFTNPVVISFAFVKYQYDRNPKLLKRLFVRRIITSQTVSLANNYYDNYYTASLLYNFKLVSNRYSYSQSLSAITNSISKTHTLDFVYSPIKRVSIYLTLGSNQQQNLVNSQFYRLALGYYW